nr:site-specific integrase [uncultured Oscillibacter sp.]
MSGKRRDSKNRMLCNKESQRKGGRYAYKYVDTTGKPQFVFSWKPEAADSTPQEKRDGLALQEKEKQIRRDIEDAIIPRGGEITVLDLVEQYLSQKTGVRHNTEANYNFVLNIIKKEGFDRQRIDRIKLSNARCWLIKLQQDSRRYRSIHSIRGVVRPAFQMAADDDLIRKNPFEFQLATVVVNNSVTKEAITRKQERAFLEFVKGDKHFSRYCAGKPMVALHREHYFKHICQKYNSIYKVQMPKVTPHICGHTFCSNMAKSGMNPKAPQYLMGHSDIGVTLNTYTHLGFEDAQEE